MKPASDAELKSEIDAIASRIDNIVRTVNRHAPETAPPSETNDSGQPDCSTEGDLKSVV